MSFNNLIEKIKSLSVVDVIKHYLQVSKKGANFLAVCPFHNDTKPSLTINEQKNIWKCFACGESGDAIGFVRKKENLSYSQAIIKIANLFNIDKNLINDFYKESSKDFENDKYYALNQRYLDLCQSFLNQAIKNNSHIKNYLLNRGITEEIINYFGIGYNPDEQKLLYELLTNENNTFINLDKSELFTRNDLVTINLATINKNGDIFDSFRNRLVFSIKNENNEIVGFSGRTLTNEEPKYLNTSQTKIFNKNEILYNFHNVKNKFEQTYILEGFMDVIALHKVDIHNAIATMGVSFSKAHLNKLKKAKIKTIILAFDNDSAGYDATLKSGISINNEIEVFVVNKYDSQYKDFDELLNKTSHDTLKQTISNQIHFSFFYLNHLKNELDLSIASNKQIFLTQALEAIKHYGNYIYKDEYINLLSSLTSISKDIVTLKINEIFTNTSHPHTSIKQQNNNKLNTQNNHSHQIKYLSVFKNMCKRLIMACLNSASDTFTIKEKYNFYGPTNTFKEFDKDYKNFWNLLNLICDFYSNYPDKTSLTTQDFNLLSDFIQKYNDSFDVNNYLNIISELLKYNQSSLTRYENNSKNLNETLKKCIINDLLIRQLLVLEKMTYNNNEKIDNLAKQYTNYTKLIQEWNKKE